MPEACVDSSLQLSISAETIHTAIHVKPLSEFKNMNPCPYLLPKHGKMPIRVNALGFYLCVLYYRSPRYPIVPSPVKQRGKKGEFKSTYI
jgi:hypothetical protein